METDARLKRHQQQIHLSEMSPDCLQCLDSALILQPEMMLQPRKAQDNQEPAKATCRSKGVQPPSFFKQLEQVCTKKAEREETCSCAWNRPASISSMLLWTRVLHGQKKCHDQVYVAVCAAWPQLAQRRTDIAFGTGTDCPCAACF